MDLATLRRFSICLVLGAFVLAPAACDSGDDDDNNDEVGDGDGDGGDGTTPCGTFGNEAITCQAGQYCADSVLNQCSNGCLNNANCAGDQTCVKDSGEDVGACQNNAGDGPTEAEFCEKALTCDPSGTMEQCSMLYAATNEGCHTCIVDGNCGDIGDGSCDAACGA